MSGRNIWTIVLVAALLNAPIYIRLMYGQVVSLRERAFVEASRAVGNSEFDTALRYVLPNALPPVFAQVPVTLGYTILITAGLSFIGAGVRPPTAEWGSMIASGTSGLTLGQWWTSVFPGVAISLTVFGFAALGEGMRHARLGAQRS
jgi:peptide/nickel transport system permease protein